MNPHAVGCAQHILQWFQASTGLTHAESSHVRVLDIGCGANLIYPLLGSSMHGWSFVAADVTDVAITWAHRNLRANPHLESLIEVRNVAPTKPGDASGGTFPIFPGLHHLWAGHGLLHVDCHTSTSLLLPKSIGVKEKCSVSNCALGSAGKLSAIFAFGSFPQKSTILHKRLHLSTDATHHLCDTAGSRDPGTSVRCLTCLLCDMTTGEMLSASTVIASHLYNSLWRVFQVWLGLENVSRREEWHAHKLWKPTPVHSQ